MMENMEKSGESCFGQRVGANTLAVKLDWSKIASKVRAQAMNTLICYVFLVVKLLQWKTLNGR